MTCRERLEQLLRERRVAYEVVRHPEVFTAQEIAAVEHISGYEVAKVVIAAIDEKLVMLVLPAPHRVDLERLKHALGAHAVRLAQEKEFANVFPDCEPGAMPPFGNLYGIAVYVDRSLTADPRIVFTAGDHRESMTMSYADYARLVLPRVEDFSTGPRHLQVQRVAHGA